MMAERLGYTMHGSGIPCFTHPEVDHRVYGTILLNFGNMTQRVDWHGTFLSLQNELNRARNPQLPKGKGE